MNRTSSAPCPAGVPGPRRARIVSLALAAVLLGLPLLACSGSSDASPGGRPDAGPGARGGRPGGGPGGPGLEAPRVPVVVGPVVRGDMEAFLDASSTLEAEERTEVVSQATGIVAELLVEEGDRVRRGQTLARLAYEDLELAERRALSELERLKSDFARAEALVREQLIPEQDYQKLRFDVSRAEIDWQQARLDLERTRITAPIGGTITRRLINRGDLVQRNAPVFEIVDFNTLVAPVFVTERALPGLRVGQATWARTAGIGTQVVPGRILRISPVVDAQSGTVRVTIALQSREGLRPGMFANVQVVLDKHENVLVVPKRALVFEEDRPHAFVVTDGRAEKRALELGYQDSERAEVVRGLTEGDTVVLVGQSALKDGSLVEVRNGSRPQGREAAGAAPAAGATAP